MSEKLNTDFLLRDGGFSNSVDTPNLARHRWYYYKEGFSPNLVAQAIEQSGVKKNDLIIDPFNGSGTTTLTSSINGFNSVGIEVNPFTAFLSKAKVINISPKRVEAVKGQLMRSVKKGAASPLIGYSTFSERPGLRKWLFNEAILNSFEGGWQFADSIKDEEVQQLMKLALISTAMENCNARKDGKCLRYYRNWDINDFNNESFGNALERNLQMIGEDLESIHFLGNAKILSGDCRQILNTSENIDGFSLCVTSPPYLNTFDYTDIYRPELFLGKFITGSESLKGLRMKTVRSHIGVQWATPVKSDFGMLYEQSISHVSNNLDQLMHRQIPMMIQAYFEDMHQILSSLRQKSARNAQVWLVVSNSAYAGMEIPVDLIIGDIATRAGWFLKEIGVMRYVRKRKTKYSPEIKDLRESVIILSASKY